MINLTAFSLLQSFVNRNLKPTNLSKYRNFNAGYEWELVLLSGETELYILSTGCHNSIGVNYPHHLTMRVTRTQYFFRIEMAKCDGDGRA